MRIIIHMARNKYRTKNIHASKININISRYKVLYLKVIKMRDYNKMLADLDKELFKIYEITVSTLLYDLM